MAFQERRGRDRLFIIAEILEIAREGTLKTQIMYRANLSYTQLHDYLKFMLKVNLLEEVDVGGKDVYKPTEKGLVFLQFYHQITDLLVSSESDKLTSEKEGMSVQVEEKSGLREQGMV